MTKYYYAAQSPRGFANEITVHRFSAKADRDAWVEEHRNDGDVNSATQGAYTVTADEARKIIEYKGDAVTESFNSLVDHPRSRWNGGHHERTRPHSG